LLLHLSELRFLNRDEAVLNSARANFSFLGRLRLLLLVNQVTEVFDLSFREGVFVRMHCKWLGQGCGSVYVCSQNLLDLLLHLAVSVVIVVHQTLDVKVELTVTILGLLMLFLSWCLLGQGIESSATSNRCLRQDNELPIYDGGPRFTHYGSTLRSKSCHALHTDT
jgi:hypothetical protein